MNSIGYSFYPREDLFFECVCDIFCNYSVKSAVSLGIFKENGILDDS